jgi:transcriptional regulator with XRE-family HTH domain
MIGVGERIRAERRKQKMSQAALAKKAGILQPALSLMERGKLQKQPKIRAKVPNVLKAIGLEGLREKSKILNIPDGARRADRSPCPYCEGTGQVWKFFHE